MTEEDVEGYVGEECINGICFASNFFTPEQRRVVDALMYSACSNSKFYYEKEIKLLRAKHRKAVKKLKDKLNKQNHPETIMN